MPEQEGRRVETTEDVWHGEGGDYSYDAEHDILWFKLPGTESLGRIRGQRSTEDHEGPRWTITEDDHGRVTVDPSIEQHAIDNAKPPIPYWHGHLKAGTWSW